MLNQIENIRIEEVANQRTTEIENGPHYMSKFVNDRLQGAVEVEKKGDSGPNTWRERWGHREEGRVKWASK